MSKMNKKLLVLSVLVIICLNNLKAQKINSSADAVTKNSNPIKNEVFKKNGLAHGAIVPLPLTYIKVNQQQPMILQQR